MYHWQCCTIRSFYVIRRSRINPAFGFEELLSFQFALSKAIDMDNLPVSTAAFRVIRNIEVYRNVDGLKKEWSRLTAQIYAMNEICLSRNKAVTSLLKLQNYGVADDEILTVYEFL